MKQVDRDAVDRDALERCIQQVRDDPEGETVRRYLSEGKWHDAALAACFHLQVAALHLKPWQPPPCFADDVEPPADRARVEGRHAAWQLRERLLARGLSIYEPDPVRALAEKRV